MKTTKVDLKYLINKTFGKIAGIEWAMKNIAMSENDIKLCETQIFVHHEFIKIWEEQYVSISKINKKQKIHCE